MMNLKCFFSLIAKWLNFQALKNLDLMNSATLRSPCALKQK